MRRSVMAFTQRRNLGTRFPTARSAVGSSTRLASSQQRHLSTVALKPWPTPMVESHGDYREEAWLEEHIGGPLYEIQTNQSSSFTLPRLPVCSVSQTLDRFVPTAAPLCRTKEEATALTAAVQAFAGQATILQRRLEERAADPSTSSWLQHWWNTWCYLQFRDSVVINVSYFFHFANDATIPTASPTTVHPTAMIRRAATLLTATADFRHLVGTGTLSADIIGKPPQQKALCATAYKYMFHACRIPVATQDTYRIYDPAQYTHVIVAVRGHYYAVDWVNAATGRAYPVAQLEAALHECVTHATSTPALGLGWCTSSHRDDWTTARTRLLAVGGAAMEQALTVLESGAVLLCLDVDATPVSRTAMATTLLHGGVSTDPSSPTGGNRWFDKSVQLVVTANGQAGLVGEHSMMDGMPMVRLADFLTKVTYESIHDHTTSTIRPKVTPVFSPALCDAVASTARPLVEKAKQDFDTLVSQNSLHVQSFQGYGSTFMKKAGYSPDAYVQVAMQLATYRLWGEQAGTYEATQVRPFLHGRTETTRSVSTESADFVRQLGLRPALDEYRDPVVRKEKLDLLQKAVQAHVKYTGYAAQAQGVDRHFLGLSMLAQEGETLPDLYADPVFQRSKRWRVSTSHLTHPNLIGWGYGQVVPDGVGLAYSIHARHCVFNITALKETGWTDQLSSLLEEALLEMRDLIESDAVPASKL